MNSAVSGLPRHRIAVAGLAALALAAKFGCRGPQTPPTTKEPEVPDGPAWFEDITAKAGLNFVHDPGEVDKFLMFQSIGSGCAIADLDGDDRPDLILLTNAGPKSISTNKLFHQKPDGTFADVSAGSGIDFPGWNMGIAIGDVNNDGKPDILITQVGGARLLLNRGELKFEDVTPESGIVNPTWGTSAAFLDYDRDGWLDLFIVNYVDYDPTRPCLTPNGEREYCGPKVCPRTVCRLFHNRGGNRPTFEDVTEQSGIAAVSGPGLGVVVADFDGDGWPDIFVANDAQPNHLWINQRNGMFHEEAEARGVARTAAGHAYAGMGVAMGDIDNDGFLDLYVTHLTSETNTLWKQSPRGQFRDRSADWEINTTRRRGTGFGTLMADFDNDGALDIAVANGRVAREQIPAKKAGLAAHWEPYGERNQLFANIGGKFRDVSHNNPALCGYFTVARGLACGDIDGDGAPDLLVNAIGEKARLLRNVAPNRGHWIAVRAVDPHLMRDAIGAEVTVRAGGVRRVP